MDKFPMLIIYISVAVFTLVALYPVISYIFWHITRLVKERQKKYIINDKSYIFESEK